MGDFLRLGDASHLRDGCGTLRLGGVGVKWESQARKGGGELGGACLWERVYGAAALGENCGGGVDRGFVSAPFQVKVCVPSCSSGVFDSRRPVLGIPKW